MMDEDDPIVEEVSESKNISEESRHERFAFCLFSDSCLSIEIISEKLVCDTVSGEK